MNIRMVSSIKNGMTSNLNNSKKQETSKIVLPKLQFGNG